MQQKIVSRLRKIEGQLARVRQDLENGTPCEVVIPQFLAVRGALAASLEVYLVSTMRECATKKSADEMTLLLETIIKKL